VGYFDHDHEKRDNKKIFKKVAQKSYLPTNEVILSLLKRHPEFKVSYSLTGVFLDQAEEYMPEVLDSFKALVDTGQVEILGETYYHSLSFLYSPIEFFKQVEKHAERVNKLFGVIPKVFRNTELIFNDDLAEFINKLGFSGVIAEGAEKFLGWRSPNFIYSSKKAPKLKLLLKNYKLSDDIAFRFSNKDWEEYPLTAPKFSNWVNQTNGSGEIVNLFMDYETFGEHQWEDTGIFDFLTHLPSEILNHPDNEFLTPTEAIDKYEIRDQVEVPDFVSWADIERDLSAWRSNQMQEEALELIYSLEEDILATNDDDLIEKWRKLQTSDHFYYMCTKWFNDGDVHKYFSPFDSPYEAFISYMNVIKDLKLKLPTIKD